MYKSLSYIICIARVFDDHRSCQKLINYITNKKAISCFLFVFSLTIKDKINISVTIKILHLGQGSFTGKGRTIFDRVIDLCPNFRYMDTSSTFVWLFTREHEQVYKKLCSFIEECFLLLRTQLIL